MRRQPVLNMFVAFVVVLAVSPETLRGQPAPAAGKPNFTAEQKAALAALYERGGILIQLDERQTGQPVVAVDFNRHPEFRDDWLQQLLPFGELRVVSLAGTACTDAGAATLQKLPKLIDLNLSETKITDAGLTAFKNFIQLRALNVKGARVSVAAIAELRKACPDLQVEFTQPVLPYDEAFAALRKVGGFLMHRANQPNDPPVVMIDATNNLKFTDDCVRYFASFPQLRTIGLNGSPLTDAGAPAFADVPELESLLIAGTKITDTGLLSLAECSKLKSLDVTQTRVTAAGIAALKKARPQLEITVEPDKLAVAGPTNPRSETPQPPTGVPDASGATDTKFSAVVIQKWRKAAGELSVLPEGTPAGWSKSRVEPAKIVGIFPKLKMRDGFVLRAYVFLEEGNSNGFVWALPADAEFPAPNACPRLEGHFLKPPKPLDALDDAMEAIAGDDSAESYLQATLLRREMKEFGGGWHGVKWGVHTILDASPWAGPPPAADAPPLERPTSKAAEWKWSEPKPADWVPTVRVDAKQAVVTFYSYTPLGEDRGEGKLGKERLIRHTETYRRGKYRPLISEQTIAEGPNVVAF